MEQPARGHGNLSRRSYDSGLAKEVVMEVIGGP